MTRKMTPKGCRQEKGETQAADMHVQTGETQPANICVSNGRLLS